MRITSALIVSIALASFCHSSASFADEILSGSASAETFGPNGQTCSESGASFNSINLLCDDSSAMARVTGNGDPFGGALTVHIYGGSGSVSSGFASGSIDLVLQETYVLIGGSGSSLVSFNVNFPLLASLSDTCSFTFGGSAAVPCYGPMTFIELMQYNVPYSVELDASIFGNSLPGEPGDGSFTYDFAQPGLVVATPEPPSGLLTMTALAGAAFVQSIRKLKGAKRGLVRP
jgi:hypothetical protein